MKLHPLPIVGRQCGDCQVCCEVMGITAIDKPHHTRCPHQCPTGCAIYSSKPDECTDYSCMWRDGLIGDDSHRPDRSGLLLTTALQPELNIGPYVQAIETSPGIIDNPKTAYWLRKIGDITLVSLWLHNGEKSFIGPPHRLRRLVARFPGAFKELAEDVR